MNRWIESFIQVTSFALEKKTNWGRNEFMNQIDIYNSISECPEERFFNKLKGLLKEKLIKTGYGRTELKVLLLSMIIEALLSEIVLLTTECKFMIALTKEEE